MKFIVALVVVTFAAAVQSKVVKKSAQNDLTSADVESLLDPTVQSLPEGQHKLVYTGSAGQEQCVVCQPFQGCGCRDVVAIRCELKRLKQKLLRLKRIAAPHQRSHHGRDASDDADEVETPEPTMSIMPVVDPLPLIKINKLVAPREEPVMSILPVVEPKPEELLKPAVMPQIQPLIKIKVAEPIEEPQMSILPFVEPIAEPKPEKIFRPAVMPQVRPLIKKLVAPLEEPVMSIQPVVKPVEEPIMSILPVVDPVPAEKKVVV